MFLVFNKSKIYSYVIALSTVLILFVAVTQVDNMVSPTNDVIETSANSVENAMNSNGINDVNGNNLNSMVSE